VKNTDRVSQSRYKAKGKQTIIDQSALSIFRNLLHRLEQVAIHICVAQQVVQLSNSSWHVQQKSRSKVAQQKSTCVIRVTWTQRRFCGKMATRQCHFLTFVWICMR